MCWENKASNDGRWLWCDREREDGRGGPDGGLTVVSSGWLLSSGVPFPGNTSKSNTIVARNII